MAEAQEFFDLVYRARWAMQMIEDTREVTLIQEDLPSACTCGFYPGMAG